MLWKCIKTYKDQFCSCFVTVKCELFLLSTVYFHFVGAFGIYKKGVREASKDLW